VLAKVFGSALRGVCKERPALAATPIPLEIAIPALRSRGGPPTAERLFAPIGWTVESASIPLDPAFPAWETAGTCGSRCAAPSGSPTR
jgi:hypothetical protein